MSPCMAMARELAALVGQRAVAVDVRPVHDAWTSVYDCLPDMRRIRGGVARADEGHQTCKRRVYSA